MRRKGSLASTSIAANITANTPLTIRAAKAALREWERDPADRDMPRIESLVNACFDSDIDVFLLIVQDVNHTLLNTREFVYESCTLFPTGVTSPSPVTTTRRVIAPPDCKSC